MQTTLYVHHAVANIQNKQNIITMFAREINTHVKYCIHVQNIWRYLYFVPIEKKDSLPSPETLEFAQTIRFLQAQIATTLGIGKIGEIKVVTRKHIDPDNDLHTDVETGEAKLITMIQVAFMDHSIVPGNLVTKHPSILLRNNVRMQLLSDGLGVLETFMVQRGMRGSSWISIPSNVLLPQTLHNKHSLTPLEFRCNASDVHLATTPNIEDYPHPSLSVIGLTFYSRNASSGGGGGGGEGKNKLEIPCICISVQKLSLPNTSSSFSSSSLASIDQLKPPKVLDSPEQYKWEDCEFLTWLPPSFPAELKKDLPANITVCSNEAAMLNYFLTRMEIIDPDMVIGFDSTSQKLDILSRHMQSLGLINVVAKLSGLIGVTGTSSSSSSNNMAGRIWCDTKSVAQEFLGDKRLVNFASLAHRLGVEYDAAHNDDICTWAMIYTSVDSLVSISNVMRLQHSLVLRSMTELDILFLSRQVSVICSCQWATVLQGSIPDRLEGLLVHEFSLREILVPDLKHMPHLASDKFNQTTTKSTTFDVEIEEENDDVNMTTSSSSSSSSNNNNTKSKAQYKGGLNLEPKRGIHRAGNILLNDFRSLYPSIIVELNLCLTNTRRRKLLLLDKNSVASTEFLAKALKICAAPPPPLLTLGQDDTLAVLPTIQLALMKLREKIKSFMKDASQTQSQIKTLNVIQSAYKLISNALYGVVGFRGSSFRFKSPCTAALIALTGQSILMRAVEIVQNEFKLDILFGDTDSLMAQTNRTTYAETMQVATRVAERVTEGFKYVKFEVGNIFGDVILYKKKKYGYMEILPSGQLKFGMKGLEMVRHDWCPLFQHTGTFVLQELLIHRDPDVFLASFKDMCASLGPLCKQVVEQDLSGLVIVKVLDKSVDAYGDNQPHVEAARKMQKLGMLTPAGTAISYVICKGDTHFSYRAWPIDMIRRSEDLEPDLQWYLETQLLPPLRRLVDVLPITIRHAAHSALEAISIS